MQFFTKHLADDPARVIQPKHLLPGTEPERRLLTIVPIHAPQDMMGQPKIPTSLALVENSLVPDDVVADLNRY
jgi:hypothetical protein